MPNNTRILVPRKREMLPDLFKQRKTDAEIRKILGRPDLDVAWFRVWVKPAR
jgi:hypothetical protein